MAEFNAVFSNRDLTEILKFKKNGVALASGIPLISVRPEPSLLGATVGQAQLITRGWNDIKPYIESEIMERCNWVAIKLSALHYHIARYAELESRRVNEINEDVYLLELFERGVRVCELDMLYEVESFFFQFKSTLDVLVKVLKPISLGKANIHTYGDSGTKVIKELEQLKKNKKLGLTGGRLDWLIEIIERAKSPFFESVINVRDTFAHYKTEMGFSFRWDSNTDCIRNPQVLHDESSVDVLEILRWLADSLVKFCADFIAISVSCALPLSTPIRPLAENEARYVGAKWQMDLSCAVWTLGSGVIREFTDEDIADAAAWAKKNIYDY